MARRVFLAHFYIPGTIFSQVMKQKPSKPLNYEKAARSDLRLVRCVGDAMLPSHGGVPVRTIPRLDLSEFANLAEFVVFSLGDQIHPGEIIAGP